MGHIQASFHTFSLVRIFLSLIGRHLVRISSVSIELAVFGRPDDGRALRGAHGRRADDRVPSPWESLCGSKQIFDPPADGGHAHPLRMFVHITAHGTSHYAKVKEEVVDPVTKEKRVIRAIKGYHTKGWLAIPWAIHRVRCACGGHVVCVHFICRLVVCALLPQPLRVNEGWQCVWAWLCGV